MNCTNKVTVNFPELFHKNGWLYDCLSASEIIRDTKTEVAIMDHTKYCQNDNFRRSQW